MGLFNVCIVFNVYVNYDAKFWYVVKKGEGTMWKYKVSRNGWEPVPAVARRIKKLDKVNIGSHEGRVKFGYNYLQFVKEGSV